MVTTSVPPGRPAPTSTDQEIRFCRGPGGVRIAYAVHGTGPPLVVVSCWLSHLQHDWQSPVWQHFLDDLGGISTLVRYDERGFGMSDWTVDDFSLDARVGDLEGVIAALGPGTARSAGPRSGVGESRGELPVAIGCESGYGHGWSHPDRSPTT